MNPKALYEVDSLFGSIPFQIVRSLNDVSFIYEPTTKISYIFLHQTKNIIDQTTIHEINKLIHIVEDYITKDKISALIFYSLNEHFNIGLNIQEIYEMSKPQDALHFTMECHELMERIKSLKITTISAVHGNCKSIGLELSLCCDFILSTNDKTTIFGFPEVKFGLIPCSGGCYFLSRKIGLIPAIKMIILGKYLNIKEAKERNLIHSIIPEKSNFFQNTRIFSLSSHQKKLLLKGNVEYLLEDNAIGRLILEKKMKNLVDSFVKGKYEIPYVLLELMFFCYTNNFLKSSEYTMNLFIERCLSEEAKNFIIIRLMLNQTQKISNICHPKFVKKIERVSVIGSDELSQEVALLSSLKGFKVFMKDEDEKSLSQAIGNIKFELDDLKNEKKLTNEEYKKISSNLSSSTKFSQNKEALEVIIECGSPESIEIKKEILEAAQKKFPNSIYAICTYNYPINLITTNLKNKENIVGLSFFKPFMKMPFVELVKTNWTSTSTIGTMYQLLLDLGKIPIIVKDSPGFLTPRLFAIYFIEAANLIFEGNSIDKIDGIMKNFGIRLGPFEAMDTIGLDEIITGIPRLASGLGKRFMNKEAKEALEFLIKKNFTGKNSKTKTGFYIYSGDQIKDINPVIFQLQTKYSTEIKKSTYEEIQDRIILSLINEASRCIMEGIARYPEDIDLAMIYEFGFPPSTGGLLHYADGLIRKNLLVSRLKKLEEKYGSNYAPTTLLKNMEAIQQTFFPERISNFYQPTSSKL
eukprot:gene5690-9511_t